MSDVPQGSVLGQWLFLLYINDMPNMMGSNIKLFADDTIMYLTITNHSDCNSDLFYRRHYKLISKYNVGLKTLLNEGLSEPEFYGDLVYKFTKLK